MIRAIAIFTTALLLSIVIAGFTPHRVKSVSLGAGWHCSQNAIMTSCKPMG